MSSSAQSTTYHSYSPVKMEGADNPGNYGQHPGLNVISPNHQFLYLQVLSDMGSPLPPALFCKDVVSGMFITQNMTDTNPEAPLDILFINDREVVIELGETANMENYCHHDSPTMVDLECRVATQTEGATTRVRALEEEDGNANLMEMMVMPDSSE